MPSLSTISNCSSISVSISVCCFFYSLTHPLVSLRLGYKPKSANKYGAFAKSSCCPHLPLPLPRFIPLSCHDILFATLCTNSHLMFCCLLSCCYCCCCLHFSGQWGYSQVTRQAKLNRLPVHPLPPGIMPLTGWPAEQLTSCRAEDAATPTRAVSATGRLSVSFSVSVSEPGLDSRPL